jgi:hypothetical protein
VKTRWTEEPIIGFLRETDKDIDDATHEAVAVVLAHTIGDVPLTRILDGIRSQRGRPATVPSDNGSEFTQRRCRSGRITTVSS